MGKIGNSSPAKVNKQRQLTSCFYELGLIFLLIDQFFLFAMLSPWRKEWQFSFVVWIDVATVIFAFIAIVLFITWACLAYKYKLFSFNVGDFILIVSITLFHYFVRVKMLGYTTYADGAIYYPQIYKFSHGIDAPLSEWLSQHRLGTHISYGYNFFAFMWEFIMPEKFLGFQWLHLFMGCAAVGAVYGIIKRILPGCNRLNLAAATLFVSLQPSIFGMFTSCNLDYPLAVFFVYALYCYVNKQYILTAFWTLALGTTKENGIMLAFVFVGSIILIKLIGMVKKKGIKHIFCKENTPKLVIVGLVAAVLIGILIYIINIPLWGGAKIIDIINFGNDKNVDVSGENSLHSTRMTFTYNKDHFWKKILQLYVLNFSWISVLLLLSAGIYLLVVKKKRQTETANRKKYTLVLGNFLVILIPYAVHTLFLLFYQEAKQPRYNMPSDYIFIIISAIVFLWAFGRKRWTAIVFAFASLLMFVQCFATIDPLSKAVFTKVDTKREPLLFTWGYADELPYISHGIGDTCFYNYQSTYMERAVDEAITRYIDSREEAPKEIYMVSAAFKGIEETFAHPNLYWNNEEKMRKFTLNRVEERDIEVLRINAWELAIDISKGISPPESAILFELVSEENYMTDAIMVLEEHYDINGPYLTNLGLAGSMNYYFIEKKNKE